MGSAFASQQWDVTPDIMTTAKALTNGAIPMGAALVSDRIHDAFMDGPENLIELFHGYTYSGHPVAAAAAIATLDIYRDEGLFEKAVTLGKEWEEAVHSLASLPNVIDVRNTGLVAGIQFAPREDGIGKRGYDIFRHCFWNGTLVRGSGDIIAMSPPLILESKHIDQAVSTLEKAIRAVN